MRRTLYAGVAATLAPAVGGGAATAGAVANTAPAVPHRLVSHRFTEHVLLGVLDPGLNARLLGGTLSGTLGGAMVWHNHLKSANAGYGTLAMCTADGSLTGKYIVTARVGGPKGPKGYTILQGSGTFTGGAGSFKGDTGQFSFKGKSPSNITYFIITFKGSYTT